MTRLFALSLLAIALFGAGCASRIVNVPIDPYVDPDMGRHRVQRVAVMPFVIPEYLRDQGGAETVSIEMTNLYMEELAGEGVFALIPGEQVKEAMIRDVPNPVDWIYNGTVREAARIGRRVGADAVVYGEIKKYLSGNLSNSEIEVETTLVEVSTLTVIWRVREVIVGRGGKKLLNEPITSVPPSRLAEIAADDAAHKVRRIHEEQGPIRVVNVSPRKRAGYAVLAGGVVIGAASIYYIGKSDEAYDKYTSADNDADLSRYRRQTKEYDQTWQILGAAGLAAVGTGIYLVLTDHTVETRTAFDPAPKTPHLAATPAVMGDGAPGLRLGLTFR
ncbi:DUF3280 domain-containing protein [bacterium]|nr:DUF3280 domain-containing protein [bacterium]